MFNIIIIHQKKSKFLLFVPIKINKTSIDVVIFQLGERQLSTIIRGGDPSNKQRLGYGSLMVSWIMCKLHDWEHYIPTWHKKL